MYGVCMYVTKKWHKFFLTKLFCEEWIFLKFIFECFYFFIYLVIWFFSSIFGKQVGKLFWQVGNYFGMAGGKIILAGGEIILEGAQIILASGKIILWGAKNHFGKRSPTPPKRMNFRKTSEEGGGGGHFLSKNLYCRFLPL